MSALLTEEERRKFAAWLEREALTSGGLAEQMAKINLPTMVADVEKRYGAACALIADRLRRTESYTL